jgi:hypothetical protein
MTCAEGLERSRRNSRKLSPRLAVLLASSNQGAASDGEHPAPPVRARRIRFPGLVGTCARPSSVTRVRRDRQRKTIQGAVRRATRGSDVTELDIPRSGFGEQAKKKAT